MTQVSAQVIADSKNEFKYGYVYVIISIIDGKKYVGQRKYAHNNKDSNYLGSGKLIKAAIKKYGKDNFNKIIIEETDNQIELDTKEAFWIEKLNTLYPIGYNISRKPWGGAYLTNHPDKEIIKNKISKSLKGKVQSKERNAKIAKAHTGKKKSQEVIDKIKQTKKDKPYKHTKESIEKGVNTRRMNGSYESKRKGKTHEEIFGKEKAEQMRIINSNKHKKIIL